jgi:Uma2 family endonuclease
VSEAIDYGDPGVPMTREAYYAWALEQGGRYERIDGVVVAMAPERIGHSRVKGNIYAQLRAAISAGGLPCGVFPDGPAVMVDDSDYQPDCIVRCADDVLADDVQAVPDPLIIVEVLSPTTARYDRTHKLREYFRLPSVWHYLMVWPETSRVVHHRRTETGEVATLTHTSGSITLDPPGIGLRIDDLYRP